MSETMKLIGAAFFGALVTLVIVKPFRETNTSTTISQWGPGSATEPPYEPWIEPSDDADEITISWDREYCNEPLTHFVLSLPKLMTAHIANLMTESRFYWKTAYCKGYRGSSEYYRDRDVKHIMYAKSIKELARELDRIP